MGAGPPAPYAAQVTQTPLTALSASPRVLIVDEDRRVQQSLGDLLRLTGRVNVIGGATDVRGALESIERENPDVVIVDPRLPDLEAGAALVATLESSRPGLRIVLAGWSVTPEQPELLNSACSYVSKNGSPEDFIAAVVDACCAPRDAAAS